LGCSRWAGPGRRARGVGGAPLATALRLTLTATVAAIGNTMAAAALLAMMRESSMVAV
jgi:hypothetical protein